MCDQKNPFSVTHKNFNITLNVRYFPHDHQQAYQSTSEGLRPEGACIVVSDRTLSKEVKYR
jgi:hypothetical protein